VKTRRKNARKKRDKVDWEKYFLCKAKSDEEKPTTLISEKKDE